VISPPVEQPTKFELVFNPKTAKQMGELEYLWQRGLAEKGKGKRAKVKRKAEGLYGGRRSRSDV